MIKIWFIATNSYCCWSSLKCCWCWQGLHLALSLLSRCSSLEPCPQLLLFILKSKSDFPDIHFAAGDSCGPGDKGLFAFGYWSCDLRQVNFPSLNLSFLISKMKEWILFPSILIALKFDELSQEHWEEQDFGTQNFQSRTGSWIPAGSPPNLPHHHHGQTLGFSSQQEGREAVHRLKPSPYQRCTAQPASRPLA